MRNVVIFGVGQLAQLASFYLNQQKEYRLVGYTTNDPQSSVHESFPLVDVAHLADHFDQSVTSVFVAISYHKQNSIRRHHCKALRSQGWNLASIISPTAVVASNCVLGDNLFIAESVVVQPWSQIGDGVVLWSGVQVGHHSVLGDYAFLSAGTVLMGCNTVGTCAHLAGGVTVRDHVTVGNARQISAGEIVLSDLADAEALT